MPLFWYLVGMSTTVAILCVLLPWLRTIPRFGALPALPWQAPLVGLLMIAASLGMYHWLGRPDLAQVTPQITAAAADRPVGNAAAAAPGAGKPGAGSMQDAVASLEARLAKGGGTADDWELLAKSYEFIGRTDAAAQARRHELPGTDHAPGADHVPTPEALKLIAKADRARGDKQFAAATALYAQLAEQGQMNADTWADYADAAGSAQGGKLAGAPETYIAKALALNPRQPKALWLKASAAEESGRTAAAVDAWQQLQGVLPPGSDDAKAVAANLQRDREILGAAPAAGAADGAGTRAAGTAVRGEVTLSEALRDKAPAGSTLFIVAKSVDSPGAPVAAYRGSAGTWPVKFTLDDSNAMMPGHNLSSAGRVTVEARISQSGQALPASGDLRGRSAVIDPARASPLRLVIDEVVQ